MPALCHDCHMCCCSCMGSTQEKMTIIMMVTVHMHATTFDCTAYCTASSCTPLPMGLTFVQKCGLRFQNYHPEPHCGVALSWSHAPDCCCCSTKPCHMLPLCTHACTYQCAAVYWLGLLSGGASVCCLLSAACCAQCPKLGCHTCTQHGTAMVRRFCDHVIHVELVVTISAVSEARS